MIQSHFLAVETKRRNPPRRRNESESEREELGPWESAEVPRRFTTDLHMFGEGVSQTDRSIRRCQQTSGVANRETR